MSWQWDPTLYAGAASYYARGRVAYPQALADLLAAELGLDGSGRLLDVGCGPGSLTLLLAPLVSEAIGVDADPDMIAEAEGLAAQAALRNVRWQVLRAEDLPAGLGLFRLVTFAQRSGLAAVVAHTGADNVAMLRMLRRLGTGTSDCDGAIVSVTLPVAGKKPAAADETPATSG